MNNEYPGGQVQSAGGWTEQDQKKCEKWVEKIWLKFCVPLV